MAPPPADDGQRFDDSPDLATLVLRLSRRVRRSRMASLEPFGLSAHEARAFLVAGRAEDHGHALPLSKLAARLHIAPRSATDVVDALEAKGLVERRRSETDRRVTNVVLTPAGRDLRAEVEAHRAEDGDELFGVLPEREQATLRRILLRLVDGEVE